MFISKPVTDIIRELNDCTSLATLRYYYSFCKNIVNKGSISCKKITLLEKTKRYLTERRYANSLPLTEVGVSFA